MVSPSDVTPRDGQKNCNAKSECVGFFTFQKHSGTNFKSLYLFFIDRLVTNTYCLLTLTKQTFHEDWTVEVAHWAQSGTRHHISLP